MAQYDADGAIKQNVAFGRGLATARVRSLRRYGTEERFSPEHSSKVSVDDLYILPVPLMMQ